MSSTKTLFLYALCLAAAIGIYFGIDAYLMTSAKPIDSLSSGQLEKTSFTTAPPFSIKDLSGRIVEPAQFKNKVLIVNFWASWCGPCVEEFPSLIKLIETYKNDVVLVAVSGDESEDAVRQFIKNYQLEGLPVFVAWDRDRSIAALYGTNKLPESYVFAKENRFFRKIEGTKNWGSPAFVRTFESLVKN